MLVKGSRCEADVISSRWDSDHEGRPVLKVRVSALDLDGDTELEGAIYFSPKAQGMAKRQLKALGVDYRTTRVSEIGKSIDLAGRKVAGGIQVDEYKGTLKVGMFGAGASAPSKEALAALDKIFAAGVDSDESAEAESAPDGDIPF